jgi:hypothetical protein
VACALTLACGGSGTSSSGANDQPDGSGGSSGGSGSSSGSSGGSGGGSGSSSGSSSGGGSGSSSGSSSGGDGGVVGDAGYPAFTPEMPQVQGSSTAVIATPRIITVTWQSDTNSTTIMDFADKLVASSWWHVLAEYGVGAGTSASAEHVVVTTAPPSPWSDDAIDTWTQTNIGNAATDGWPAADANSIYVVYVPPSAMVTDPSGDPCDGYHSYVTPGSANVAYALIFEQCYTEDMLLEMQDTTETGSHEIAEASTDPYPGDTDGFTGFDADHLGWELWNAWQDEVADACEYFDDGYYLGGTDEPYWLSRIWSNAGAKAGHNPCVPAPTGPYNNTTPLGLQSISVKAVDPNDKISPFTTQGIRISPGQTGTVQIGFYSDAPTAPWTVTASEWEYCKTTDKSCPTTALTISPTTFTGQNGDVVSLSIKVNNAPSEGTAAVLQLASAVADTTQCPQSMTCNHWMPVVIGTY